MLFLPPVTGVCVLDQQFFIRWCEMILTVSPRWCSPLPWLPPPPASQMIAETMLMFPEIQNCNEGKRICLSFSLFNNFCFVLNFAEYLLPSFLVFSVSFTLSVKIGNFYRSNLFLVHVLRYVAACVPRVLNSYLMTRQRWRDRGEEGVSVAPSPRYSSGCQIIFSQTFNFPILATTRAIHWKLPDHSGQATVTIGLSRGNDQELKLMP